MAETMEELLTMEQATKILNIHASTLRRWEKEGKIKAVRTPGNQRRFKAEDIHLLYREHN